MNYKDDFLYTKEHIWVKSKEEYYLLGITFFAQDLLGDIVFLDLKNGTKFSKGTSLGSIESVKTASDIIAPADGEIILINPDAEKSPEKINDDPHATWICQIKLSTEINTKDYLSKEQYLNLINT